MRARLGVAFDRALVYVTGGLAYGDVSYQADFLNQGGALQFAGRSSDLEIGYALGAGVEYAFTNNLTARVEYRYTNFEEGISFEGTSADVDLDQHAIRAGVSFKF